MRMHRSVLGGVLFLAGCGGPPLEVVSTVVPGSLSWDNLDRPVVYVNGDSASKRVYKVLVTNASDRKLKSIKYYFGREGDPSIASHSRYECTLVDFPARSTHEMGVYPAEGMIVEFDCGDEGKKSFKIP